MKEQQNKLSNNDISLNISNNYNSSFNLADKSSYKINVQGARNRGKLFEGIENNISFQGSYRNQQFSKQDVEDFQDQDFIDEQNYHQYPLNNINGRDQNSTNYQDQISLKKEQSQITNEYYANTVFSNTNRENNTQIYTNNQTTIDNSPNQTFSFLQKQIAWLNERVSAKLEDSPNKASKRKFSYNLGDLRSPQKKESFYQKNLFESKQFIISKDHQKDDMMSSQRIFKEQQSSIQNDLELENTVSIKNYLVIFTYLKRFTMNLLKKIAYKNPINLKKIHLLLIDDKTNQNILFLSQQKQSQIQIEEQDQSKYFDPLQSQSMSKNFIDTRFKKKQKNKSFCQQIKERLQQKIESHFLQIFSGYAYKPDHALIIILNIILLFQLVSHILIIPIKLCFFIQAQQRPQFLSFYSAAVVCLILEIFIAFQTGYYESGILVLDKIKIAKSYVKFQFWVEICSIILIIMSLIKQISIIECIIVILRFDQIRKKINRIDEHFEISSKFPTLYQLSKLSGYILIMAHFWGCGFNLIGIYSKQSGQFNPQNNWISMQKLDESEWVELYINSIYFTIITMITIGYGDIAPINIYEKIYVCFMTFITCGLFAYCVNCIGTIFAEINQKEQIFRQKRYEISNYLKFKGTKKETYIKIIKYIEYLHQESEITIAKGNYKLKI